MPRKNVLILVGLGLLTVAFLSAAAYTFWRGGLPDAQPDRGDLEPLPLGEAPQALRLTVTQTGVATVHARQLQEANLPYESFSAAGLSLTRDGRPVPFTVLGEGADAALYFYAEAITRTLEAPAVYWLSPGEGQAMATRESQPAGEGIAVGLRQRHWEDNKVFLGQAAGDDVWLGQLIFAPSAFEIALDSIRPTGGPGRLIIRLWSNNQAPANPDHHVEIFLNGNKVTDHFWDGITQESITLPIPAGLLQPENNVLTISAPGDTGAAGEALYVDWIRLEYEGQLLLGDEQLFFESDAANLAVDQTRDPLLLFDVSNPAAPTLLTNVQLEGATARFASQGAGRYLALHPGQAIRPQVTLAPLWESPLKSADQGADYIAIVAPVEGFDEALQPLLDHRQAQGMRVKAVSLDQIYDEFAYGRRAPAAIRDFLAYAAVHWQEPAPRYVLLVGDASYDHYRFSDGAREDLLPTYLIYTEYAGYVASDTWYTMLDGDSLAPALAVGRFPAQTAEQLEIMVGKTLAYEEAAASDWVRQALLVADDEPSFDNASNRLANELERTGYATQKLYMSQNEDIGDAIISALNQGVSILNYVGHGSIEVWGDERVFEAGDATSLINRDRLPIFTTFTCLNGYFNHPQVDSLAETLLWTRDGGVVAAVAPSGRSLPSQQLPLADVFYQQLLTGDAATVGEALHAAKVAGAGDAFLSDVIHTFNLLGDPALHFQLPSP